jgi:hypothetical protein
MNDLFVILFLLVLSAVSIAIIQGLDLLKEK